jgi:hypothetical protein
MPSRYPFVVALRGTPAYARYLDRLARRAKRHRGVDLVGPHAVAEYALACLGAEMGIRAPARVPSPGGKRPGAGRPRKKIDGIPESGIDS